MEIWRNQKFTWVVVMGLLLLAQVLPSGLLTLGTLAVAAHNFGHILEEGVKAGSAGILS